MKNRPIVYCDFTYFQISSYEIFEIFQGYGAIRRIILENDHTRQIIFEHSDSTKQLSKQTEITIGNERKLGVYWLKYEHKRDKNEVKSIPEILKAAPDQASRSNILNKLPNECLRTIFEASPLNVMDLLEIANVCRQFNAIAIQIFETNYKEFNLAAFGESGAPVWRKEIFFRTFGPSITSITKKLNNIECEMVAKYCSSIKVLHCHVTEQTSFDKVRTLFTRLDVLNMCLGNIHPYFEDWFGGDSQLKSLTLISDGYINELVLPNQNISRLTELAFGTINNIRMCNRFFAANPQLLVLKNSYSTFDLAFNVLIDYLPNLTELLNMDGFYSRSQIHTHDVCNAQHTQFRTFSMTIYDDGDDGPGYNLEELRAILQHKVPLETLVIKNLNGGGFEREDDYIEVIRQITTLKCLDVDDSFHGDDFVIRLVNGLPNLTKLTIRNFGISKVRRLIEVANQRSTDLHVVYIKHSNKNLKNILTELDRLSASARARGIILRMSLVYHKLDKNKNVSMILTSIYERFII